MNRITMIERLLHAGVETKDAPKMAEAALKDRAGFYSKLVKAQGEMAGIVKDKSGYKGSYASVDEFVKKGGESLQQAGLAIYASSANEISKVTTNGDGIEVTSKHWTVNFVLGDSSTGYREDVLFALPMGKEQDAGAADSYCLKYFIRDTMFAERAENDPDKRKDVDKVGSRNNVNHDPAPKAPSSPSKPSKRKTTSQVARSRERLKVCSEEVGAKRAGELLKAAGNAAPKNAKQLEQAADLLESRIVFDRLQTKVVDILGQPKVDKMLKDIGDINNIIALKEGTGMFVDVLNTKTKE